MIYCDSDDDQAVYSAAKVISHAIVRRCAALTMGVVDGALAGVTSVHFHTWIIRWLDRALDHLPSKEAKDA